MNDDEKKYNIVREIEEIDNKIKKYESEIKLLKRKKKILLKQINKKKIYKSEDNNNIKKKNMNDVDSPLSYICSNNEMIKSKKQEDNEQINNETITEIIDYSTQIISYKE